jgi:hypothetical protein
LNTRENAHKAVQLYEKIESLKHAANMAKNLKSAVIAVERGTGWGESSFPIDIKYARKVGAKFFIDQIFGGRKRAKALGFEVK